MRIEIVLAFLGFLLYVAGYVLGSMKRYKDNRIIRIVSYVLVPLGVFVYALFGSLWMKETYANDKTYLSILAVVFSALSFLFLPAYSWSKEKAKTLSSIALACTFLFAVAFLVCMIALSQDAILNGLGPEESSSLLQAFIPNPMP